MTKNKMKIYCAGGWFNDSQRKSLDEMESLLRSKTFAETYFPRHDGIKLKPGEFHDPKMRQAIFNDNVHHIKESDIVVACVDSTESTPDTGTLWEIGYALARNIPVYAYDPNGKVLDYLKKTSDSLESYCDDLRILSLEIEEVKSKYLSPEDDRVKRVLLLTPHKSNDYQLLAATIIDAVGNGFYWVDDYKNADLFYILGTLDIDLIVAVIDDRDPSVSMAMGVAHEYEKPIVTYSGRDYGVNIMLLCSVLTHVKGKKDMREFLRIVTTEGLSAVEEFDHSGIKAE